MNVAALPSSMPAMNTARTLEAKEGPGPDHDGDSDDKTAGSATAASASPPAGMGKAVDVKA